MHFTRRLSLVLILITAIAIAAGCSKTKEPPKELDLKTAEKEADGVVESVIPSPDTIFLAMSTLGKPKWDGVIKPIEKESFDSETQTALVTGMHLAHFFVYVHTKDKDNANKAIDALVRSAKQLDVKVAKDDEKKVRDDIKAGKWDDLRYNLSSLNGKMTDQLIEDKKRPDQVMLISLGAWLEGAYVASKVLGDNYSKKAAVVLQQADLIKDVKKATGRNLKKDDKYTKIVLKAMDAFAKNMKGKDAPSQDDVKKIHDAAAKARTNVLK